MSTAGNTRVLQRDTAAPSDTAHNVKQWDIEKRLPLDMTHVSQWHLAVNECKHKPEGEPRDDDKQSDIKNAIVFDIYSDIYIYKI